jgi:hypothetical protein
MNQKMALLMSFLVLGGLSCSPENPKAHIIPDNTEEKVVQDNTQVFDPKVDILFVVDNSGSMGTHQQNLSANVSKFTQAFIKGSILDYNIGIVTTDMDDYNWRSKPCCGELIGAIKVVNKATQNADRILSQNFLVGTSGSADEMSFDPVFSALSPPNLTTKNAGFYRQDATLVVIFLTDAEDQSKQTSAQGLYKFLVDLKNGNRDKVLSYGVLVPSNDTTRCERDDYSSKPLKIESFLSMVVNNKNNVMNICDPDYGTRLANMAKDIVDKVGNIIYLDLPPDIASIRVTYGSVDLPKNFETGWSFDVQKNAIILGSKINWGSQPSGSRVKVFYDAATLD